MTSDADGHEQVAGRAAVDALIALPAQNDGLIVVDTGGNFDRNRPRAARIAGAPAVLAGLLDGFSLAAAALADARGADGSERGAPRCAHLPAAVADGTRLDRAALGRARSVAVVAFFHAVDRDILCAAKGRLLKGDLNAAFQILAAPRRVSRLRRAPAEAAAENRAENVAEIAHVKAAEAAAVTALSRAVIRVDARKTELVVFALLLRVGQDLISLVDLFKLRLGRLVARI